MQIYFSPSILAFGLLLSTPLGTSKISKSMDFLAAGVAEAALVKTFGLPILGHLKFMSQIQES